MGTDRLEFIEEMVRQLRPLLGDKADRWLDLWVAEERDGREEIERMLLMEFRKQFPNHDAIVLSPPERQAKEGLVVGTIMHDTKPVGEFVIPPNDLLRHTLITGATGAGKTTLIFQVVRELLRERVPFFLFDFKLDYRPLLGMDPRVRLFTIGQPLAPLSFNPLVELARPLVQARRVRDWAPIFQLSDVLCRVFYGGHGVRSLLNKAFVHVVQDWAEHDLDPDFTPTFQFALKWLRDFEGGEKGMRVKEWKASTVRILEQLSMGEFGRQMNSASDKHKSYTQLRMHPTVFELNLPEDLKNCFVETLLLCGRQAGIEGLKEHVRGTLKHVMIVDESHNLMREYPGLGESQLQLALREHRGLGTAYILADQTPSQLDKTAFANTRYKFFFALLERGDIQVANRSLLLSRDQEEFLARLSTGTCIARFGTSRPFLLRVPGADDVMRKIVTDGEVREAWERLSASSGPESGSERGAEVSGPSDKKPVTPSEKRLLIDILAEPFAGVQKHYDRLKISSRNGNSLKESMEQRGLLRGHEITLADTGGRKVVLELLQPGVELLQHLGYTCKFPYFANGAEHEHAKAQVAQHLQAQGYKVTKEFHLPGEGRIDVVGERGPERVAVEVETGKSDIEANLAKLEKSHANRAIAVPTNSHARGRLHDLQPEHPTIEIKSAEDLDALSLPETFYQHSGPEKLFLLLCAEHLDPRPLLPPPPAGHASYWVDVQQHLVKSGLIEVSESDAPTLTSRGRRLLEAIGFVTTRKDEKRSDI